MEITGPDGNLVVTINPDDERGSLTLERDSETVLEPSPYGLETPAGKFPTDFEYQGRSDREIHETYTLPHGKAGEIDHRAIESTLEYGNDEGTAQLVVRVTQDGLAYRYRVLGTDSFQIPGEETGYQFPQNAVAYLSGHNPSHESNKHQTPIGVATGEYSPPLLVRNDTDLWALVGEAAADGTWGAGRFEDQDQGFSLEHKGPINIELPGESPWRFVVAGDLGTIVESTMATDLVDGPAIDADWVEPGRVAWSWWSDSESPSDPEVQREYVDYAADQGWEYVLVDAGWKREWMPEFVEYAQDKGVGVLLWTHYTELRNANKRADRLSRWVDWGVDGIKVDFMKSDDQGRVGFYDDVARAAADRGLLVNFHGCVVPSGLKRRWPNVMTYESARANEYLAWSTLPAEHTTTLPFTRNVVGPMDYTPVALSSDDRTTTAAHELALAVVYESGLQHYAEGIENFEEWPLAEDLLVKIPAAWDETRFLRGKPGCEATLARRSGEEWFVGCITADAAGPVRTELPFLETERDAEIIHDDGTDSLTQEQTTLAPDAFLEVEVPENGGFIAHLL